MSSNLQRPSSTEFDALTSLAYAEELWTDCVKDCENDKVKAELQYCKMMRAVVKQLNRPRSAESDMDSTSDEEISNSSTSSSSSNSSRGTKRRRRCTDLLKWEKPGSLSRRLGINKSVLRTLANVHAVHTMTSPGGHRLFNVESVMQYIESTTTDKLKLKNIKKQVTSKASELVLPAGHRQLLVYVQVHGANQSHEQLQTFSDGIQSQVHALYKNSCTPDELKSCLYTFELDSDQPGNAVPYMFSNTHGTRRLLKSLCSRDHERSLLILRSNSEISKEPSTYYLFTQLCRNMNVTIDIVPELNNTI